WPTAKQPTTESVDARRQSPRSEQISAPESRRQQSGWSPARRHRPAEPPIARGRAKQPRRPTQPRLAALAGGRRNVGSGRRAAANAPAPANRPVETLARIAG